jgi:inward rectifier potassium channel
MKQPRVVRVRGPEYEFRVIGVPPTPLRDLYHALLRQSWPATLLLLVLAYTGLNALFALLYLEVGGIAYAQPGSFGDAFFFSVQTLGTIGYGHMYPESLGAEVLVFVESVVALLSVALSTGLVFAKFSRPTARVEFTREVVVAAQDGVPTLSFRVGNARGNQIVDVQLRATMVRTETMPDGRTFYRTLDLKLVRERILTLSRSWTVMHRIDETSPLFGETPESLIKKDVELTVAVIGLDDTSLQPVHALHRYFAKQILFEARHADILSETPDALVVDLRRFHDVERTSGSQTG